MSTLEPVLILNDRLPSSVCDRTLFGILHMQNLGEDDVLFPFLRKEEKEKLNLSFRGYSAENRDFSSRLLCIYTDSLYVVLSFHVLNLT